MLTNSVLGRTIKNKLKQFIIVKDYPIKGSFCFGEKYGYAKINNGGYVLDDGDMYDFKYVQKNLKYKLIDKEDIINKFKW